MVTRTLILAFAVCCATHGRADAQFRARSVNPEAVEFESAILVQPDIRGYRVEFFLAGSDTRRDSPVKILNLGPEVLHEGGKVRVPLKDTVLDMPNGQYVATIRTLGTSPSVQSEPTDVFVLAQEGEPTDRIEAAKRERFWTKFGIALGAGIFLIPVVIR